MIVSSPDNPRIAKGSLGTRLVCDGYNIRAATCMHDYTLNPSTCFTMKGALVFLVFVSTAFAQTSDLNRCTYTDKQGKVYDLSALISTRYGILGTASKWGGRRLSWTVSIRLLCSAEQTQCSTSVASLVKCT